MPRRLLAPPLALALACGPSLARLERGHHYDEAVCGAAERAFPEEQVAKVIRRALDPALHVAVVPRQQLAAVLGDDLPELDHVALLVITRDSNTIPLSGVDATVALRRRGEPVELEPGRLETFAAVFKERVPGPRTVGPGAIESAAHAVGTAGAIVLTVVSLGLLRGLLRGLGPGPKSRTVYPSDDEIRRAAPRASRLYDAVAHLQSSCSPTPGNSCAPPFDAVAHLQSSCSSRPGTRCRTLALVPRPPEEPADLALSVELRYSASCTFAGVDDTVTIPLPPGPTLEARLAAVFGQDMRRLSDLSAPPR